MSIAKAKTDTKIRTNAKPVVGPIADAPAKPKKPVETYSLDAMLSVMTVLEQLKQQEVLAERMETSRLLERYLKDVRRRLRPFAVKRIVYVKPEEASK